MQALLWMIQVRGNTLWPTIGLDEMVYSQISPSDVVTALAGCCKWALDLLSWLCDSLFCLLNDSKFKSILSNPAQFSQLASYLHEKNEIALHLVLCSSIRSLLGGVCRRITMLHALSHRAICHYENNPHAKGSSYGSPLHVAYQKVYRHTSAALVNPEVFQSFLASLNLQIREVYSTSFSKMGEQGNKTQGQHGGGGGNQQNKNLDEAGVRGRQHCELQMLLGQAPPPTFQPIIMKFMYQDMICFRDGPNNGGSPHPPGPPPGNASSNNNNNTTNTNTNNAAAGGGGNAIDPARLYFADYDLLEVDDGRRALESRRARGVRVDMFKRIEITRPSSSAAGASRVPWRRCVRCAAVMEDPAATAAAANRPHLNFVLGQQRNCCCGGRLAWVD